MKVIFTLDTIGNAGTERSVLDIVSHFSKEMEVKVVYFYPDHHFLKAYEAAGIPVQFEQAVGRFAILTGVRKLKKIIKQEQPDLVVSSILLSNLISRIACKQLGVKLVGTFVSDSYSSMRKRDSSLKRRAAFQFFYQLDKFTSRIPVGWISNAESIKTANCANLGIDPAMVKVIYRGRDPKKFLSRQKTPSAGIFRFVYVGRLLETKGLRELIEGFRIVATAHPSVSLDIYGEGNFYATLSGLVKDAGLAEKVILHGIVADGWEKMYEADCYVFPSWYEGFSGSLVEAMLAGIPIIASDIPMNLEAVTNNKTALVHKVKDAKSIAEQMQTMIEHYDRMLEMGRNAREEALRRFDIKVIAAQYEAYLKEIAGTRVHKGAQVKSVDS